MADDTPFVLTQGERQSALWLRLIEHFEAKLAIARGKLEGDIPETQTAQWRGQIQILRALLALSNVEPPIDG